MADSVTAVSSVIRVVPDQWAEKEIRNFWQGLSSLGVPGGLVSTYVTNYETRVKVLLINPRNATEETYIRQLVRDIEGLSINE